MTSIEDIKRDWANLTVENEILNRKNRELTRELSARKIRSYQEKLSRSYRIGYIGFFFPLLALMMYRMIDMSVAVCIAYALFGLIAGFYNLWFRSYVRKTDYMSMPVVEAVIRASKVVRYQNRSVIIGILATLLLLWAMFADFVRIGDMAIVVGGVAGAVIGGIIGAARCIRNHRHAAAMLREVKNI